MSEFIELNGDDAADRQHEEDGEVLVDLERLFSKKFLKGTLWSMT